MALMMALSMVFAATVRHLVPVDEHHSFLGVIQGLKVIVVVTANDVTLWHHLQVGSDAVVAGPCVITEVDDAAFIGALIRWFDPGETEFVGDVASYNLHDLAKLEKRPRKNKTG